MQRWAGSWIRCPRRGSLLWTSRLRGYARVAEAAALLVVARVLVAFVPMRHWRTSLGTIRRDADAGASGPTVWAELPPGLRAIVRAVKRADVRLPIHLKCLPRAMALQWMARRRRLTCTLHIGIDRGAAEDELHAWVDHGQVTIIGALPGRAFVGLLTIVSVDAAS